jgi:hypothetical protein
MVWAMLLASALGALGAWAAAAARSSPARAAAPARATTRRGPATPADTITRVLMHNVGFHLDDRIVLNIDFLSGTMRSRRPGGPIIFDDKRSFVIHIDDARVRITTRDLSLLLNRYVFGYPGSPLRDLRVGAAGRRIRQTGILHKGVDIPFEITAELSVTADGHLRLHPVATRIFRVNGDRLMRALGLTLEDLLDLRGATGATVRGNDIFLDPDRIIPPPAIEGRVTAAYVDGGDVVQVFGDSTAWPRALARTPPPDPGAANYMYYRGGTLEFGKLIMLDADLQIIDADPGDPFDFNLGHYTVQLVAGYSRTLPGGGLEVFMPDFDDAARKMTADPAGSAPPRVRR